MKKILSNVIKHSSNQEDYNFVKKSPFFDAKWYKKTYSIKGNAASHYCNIGYKLGYCPSKKFSRIKYELLYEDVRYTNTNPLYHFEKYGKYEPFFLEKPFISNEEKLKIEKVRKLQNQFIAKEFSNNLENLIIFLVPEIDFIGGGVMSVSSIAKVSSTLENIHHSKVMLCTVPSERTFFKYSKFVSQFNIYRFSQLKEYFLDLKNVIIHIPEIYVHPFLYFLTVEEELWLKSIPNLTINILNQNADILPRPRIVDYLKTMSTQVTMTCAHKSYSVKQLRTSYDIPVHWLSTSNFVKYNYKNYRHKKNILLYSPDDNPLKEKILNKIKNSLPSLKLVEIKNMKYTDYLENISNAKYMITFGEGLDGYFSESSRSGTLSFAVYNPTFFNKNYYGCPNIYESYNTMYENIVNDLIKYDKESLYNKIVNRIIQIDKKEYDDNVYVENIKKYYQKEYTFPMEKLIEKRKKLLNRNPLISIAVATYNGEKYIKAQIDSLLKLEYKNVEIIVSDDNSTDSTYAILETYGEKIKLYKNSNKGLSSNFINAITHCSGEYIALCDQDDIWEKDKLNILLEHIDDFDIVHGGVCVIDSDGNYHPNKGIHTFYEIDKTMKYEFKDYIKENLILGCTSLIKASFLKKVLCIPSEAIYHDWWFSLNAIKYGNGVVYVDKQIIKYRKHDSNTSAITYNNSDWYLRKIKFNNYILSNFKNLNGFEKRQISIDSNYNLIKHTFDDFIPNGTYTYFDNNYYYFSDEFIEALKKQIEKKY